MSVLPAAAARLVEANLRFLEGVDAALANRLKELTTTLTQPIVEGDTVIDIDIGGDRLYGQAAGDFAAEQVAAFIQEPARILVRRPDADTLNDPCSATMVRRIEARLEATGVALLAAPPPGRSGVRLVLGVGLGPHLDALIEQAGARHVVLVEPIDEFLRHSLATVDWAALYERCRGRGTSCHIVTCDDAAATIGRLDELFTEFGETALDGTYIYVHYTTPVTHAVAGQVHDFVSMKSILKGYFTDECLMVDNTSANAAAHAFRLVEGTLGKPLDAPAFIVGSGPSLDASIAALVRERDRGVVFTAGSSLQAVLNAGIVPDFHVEKENLFMTVERLRHIVARNAERFPTGKFSGIRLVASTTVDPGVLDLFDDKYLFLRSALSSTAMFGAGHEDLDGTSPYSANAALTLAAVFGFRELYLFGCDCGARDADRHHSAETVYYTLDGKHAATKVTLEQRCPANFGGHVLTNPYFTWSRFTHEQIIAAAGLTVRNCSDGVRINGAAALRPEDLSLSGRAFDRTAVHDAVRSRSTWYPAGGLLDEQDVAGAVAAWHDLAKAVRDRLAALRGDAADVHTWYRRFADLFDDAANHSRGTGMMLAGTARTLPSLASYYLNRVDDQDDVASLFAWFLDICDELFEEQLAAGSELMTNVAARAENSDAAMRGTG